MQNSFKGLIEDYAFHGLDAKHLSKDELFGLSLAYLEDKFSKWPWKSVSINDEVDVPITIGMLRKLNSNLYNQQKAFLEEVKAAVIEEQMSDISEALDDERERARNDYRYLNDYKEHFGTPVKTLIIFNAVKKQGASYGR